MTVRYPRNGNSEERDPIRSDSRDGVHRTDTRRDRPMSWNEWQALHNTRMESIVTGAVSNTSPSELSAELQNPLYWRRRKVNSSKGETSPDDVKSFVEAVEDHLWRGRRWKTAEGRRNYCSWADSQRAGEAFYMEDDEPVSESMKTVARESGGKSGTGNQGAAPERDRSMNWSDTNGGNVSDKTGHHLHQRRRVPTILTTYPGLSEHDSRRSQGR